jgi:hypothetical protein
MKSSKLFCLVCTFFCASFAAAETPPALYSFDDIYRLALAGPVAQPGPLAAATTSEPTIRVASVQAPAQAEPRFTVEPLPGPKAWMLVLAGLAAAGWVAHRRLAQL